MYTEECGRTENIHKKNAWEYLTIFFGIFVVTIYQTNSNKRNDYDLVYSPAYCV